MKTIPALVLATFGFLFSTANASIFLEKMTKYLNTPSMDTLKELVIWQIGGLLFPILAGPLRVVAWMLWTTGEGSTPPVNELLQSYMFLNHGITSFDSFNGYWVDYIIYGMLYKMVSLDVGFVEIDFVALTAGNTGDMLCYNLNGYGTVGGGTPTRTNTGDLDVYT